MKVLQQFPIKSVLVTGCNRGIGLELIKYFAEQNKKNNDQPVKVISSSIGLSSELNNLLSEHIFHVELNVTDTSSVSAAVQKVSDIVGNDGLNLLINNAAIMYDDEGVLDCSDQAMKETFNVNVIGPLSVTNLFHPLLKLAAECNSEVPLSCARAAVFNISSQQGSIHDTKTSSKTAYRVSKAALNMLTKCQASEFIKDGIICLSVHPCWVLTDLENPRAPLSYKEAVKDHIVQMITHCTEDHNGMFARQNFVPHPY